jgi:hypothetical protein
VLVILGREELTSDAAHCRCNSASCSELASIILRTTLSSFLRLFHVQTSME